MAWRGEGGRSHPALDFENASDPSVKNDKQYEGLRDKGMSKQHAAAISNCDSTRGGKKVSFRRAMDGREQGQRHQGPEAAAGRKGGKKSS
jgi:hypothetical protein